jgi:hypothetical protein
MISHSQIPIWPIDDGTRYYRTYAAIIQNFEKAFELAYPRSKILFIDNTYINAEQVISIIHNNPCDVVAIFSLTDPAYAWHYIKEQLDLKFPDLIKFYIGNHSPDINIIFWFLVMYNEWATNLSNDVTPKNFKYIYLNYTSKPHSHRLRLFEQLKSQKLDGIGFNTVGQFQVHSDPTAIMTLGDLDIWNQHFLTIVGSTVFNIGDGNILVSEKESKPFIGMRPFIINGSPKNYQELERMGFDTFKDLWPVAELSSEDDSLEATQQKCHGIICDVVCELQTHDLAQFYEKLFPRLEYNYHRFMEYCGHEVDRWCHQPITLPPR